MAVMLGVSDKVIEQLKLAAPQVVDDRHLYTTMMWCDSSRGMDSPANTFSSGFGLVLEGRVSGSLSSLNGGSLSSFLSLLLIVLAGNGGEHSKDRGGNKNLLHSS